MLLVAHGFPIPRDLSLAYIDVKEKGSGEEVPLEPGTIKDYRRIHEHFVDPFPEVGDYALSRATPEDGSLLRTTLIEKAVSRDRVRKELSYLKGVGNWAHSEPGLIAANLLSGIRIKKEKTAKADPKAFMQEEVTCVLRIAEAKVKSSHQVLRKAWRIYFPMLTLLATTGIRTSECLGLRWSDFTDDLTAFTISRKVRRYNGNVTAENRIGPLKSVYSNRTLPIAPVARILLEELRVGASPDVYVFPNSKGGSKSYDNVRRNCWVHLMAEAGTRKLGLHSLRHFYASVLLREGMTTQLKEFLGHHSTAFTLVTYVSMLQSEVETREQVRSVMDAVLPQKTGT